MKTYVITECMECGGMMEFDSPYDLGASMLGPYRMVTLGLVCANCGYCVDLEVLVTSPKKEDEGEVNEKD